MGSDFPLGEDEELVRFFRSLPVESRREYELLAEHDRRFGEDVGAERRHAEEGRT